MKRDTLLSLRLSQPELAAIEALAAQANLTVSAYVRASTLASSTPRKPDPLLRHDLARLSVLLARTDLDLAEEVRSILRRLP